MAESVRNLFDKARALLNTYTEDGVQMPEADYADMMSKAIPLFDMAHSEIYESCRLDETKDEPDTITSINDPTEVNYKANQALVYYCAARLAPFKKKELVQYFEDKYEQLKISCKNKSTFVDITDEYPLPSEQISETEF
jgi:hypothetical protein